MPKFLSKVNLPQYAAAPGSPAQGDMYYNTTDDTVYVYDGASWLDLAASGGGPITLGTDTTGNYMVDVSVQNGLSVSHTPGEGSTATIGVNNALLSNYLLEGASGNSYGLIGTSAYLDVKNTNGYNKEIELDIAAVETKLSTDGYITTANKVTDLAAPTSSFSMSSQKITSLGTPTAAGDAATKAYVDGVAEGLDVKASCRLATTDDHGLSGLANIDLVTPIAGDRILVKNQATGSQNGIYVAASGSWSRADDAAQSGEITPGTFVFVEQGDTQADSGWVVTTNGTITIGATDITWSQFSGAGQITAGAGLTKSGNTLDVVAGTGITVNANDVAVNTAVIPTISGANTVTLTTSGTTALTLPTSGTVATTSNNLGAFTTSTSAAIGVGAIELGHATDTTLARVSAGVISVEGKTIPRLYSAALTGTGTSFTVTHGLGAVWVSVMVYDTTTGKYLIPDHTIVLSSGTPTGDVTITFPASVTGSNYRVVITG